MKKNIFKKIVASLATVAMAAGLFTVMPAEEAKAAAPTEVYLVGSLNGWNADAPIEMEQDGNTWSYEHTVTETGFINFKVLVGGKGWGNDKGYSHVGAFENVEDAGSDNNMKVSCANTGKVNFEVTFDNSGAITKVKASGTALGAVVLPDEYYVVGDAGLCNPAWGDESFAGAVQLTEKSAGVWACTIKNVEPKTYNYNVIQLKGWDNKLADTSVEVTVKSDVTFTYTKATGDVEVTVTPVQEESSNTSTENTNNSTEANQTTTGSQETTAAADKTTTKAPETTKKEEAKKGITVEVALSADAKWDKVFIYAFPEGEGLKAWPGVEMTAKDGKWYATLDTTATKLSYVISNGNGEQTVDVKDVEGQNIKITLGAKNAEGKFEASAKAVAAGGTGSAKPGDAAPMVMMFAVAAVAAGMVVASKKKTICE